MVKLKEALIKFSNFESQQLSCAAEKNKKVIGYQSESPSGVSVGVFL